jgi:hypothetical protein
MPFVSVFDQNFLTKVDTLIAEQQFPELKKCLLTAFSEADAESDKFNLTKSTWADIESEKIALSMLIEYYYYTYEKNQEEHHKWMSLRSKLFDRKVRFYGFKIPITDRDALIFPQLVKWFLTKNDDCALCLAGYIYQHQFGVGKDELKAISFYKMASVLENSYYGLFHVGYVKYVYRDHVAALSYWEQAAQKGNPSAILWLANFHYPNFISHQPKKMQNIVLHTKYRKALPSCFTGFFSPTIFFSAEPAFDNLYQHLLAHCSHPNIKIREVRVAWMRNFLSLAKTFRMQQPWEVKDSPCIQFLKKGAPYTGLFSGFKSNASYFKMQRIVDNLASHPEYILEWREDKIDKLEQATNELEESFRKKPEQRIPEMLFVPKAKKSTSIAEGTLIDIKEDNTSVEMTKINSSPLFYWREQITPIQVTTAPLIPSSLQKEKLPLVAPRDTESNTEKMSQKNEAKSKRKIAIPG